MGVSATAEVTYNESEETHVVTIEDEEEKGLLIGKRGETLSSIQAILGMMLFKKTGEWSRVVVNIGDWREKNEMYLKDLARVAVERARETGVDQPIYNLNPAQRRVVHLALSGESDIESESVGEGRDRYLVVKLKKSS